MTPAKGAAPMTVGEVVGTLRLSFRAVRDLMDEPGDPLPSYVDFAGTLWVDRHEFGRWLSRRSRRGLSAVAVPTLTQADRIVLAAIAAAGSVDGAAGILGAAPDAVRSQLQHIGEQYRAVGAPALTLPALLERAARDGYVLLQAGVSFTDVE